MTKKSKPPTTVTFLGEEVSIAKACEGQLFGGNAKRKLHLRKPFLATDWWLAFPTGPLTGKTWFGNGKTAQQAATDLERLLLKEFRNLGKHLGYDVD